MSVSTTIAMSIGGRPHGGGGLAPVENPALGRTFAHAPLCTPDQLDEAVAAARSAGHDWAAATEDVRRGHLLACGKALADRVDEVAGLLTREQGKPLGDARAEVQLAAGWFADTAALTLEPESLVADEASRIDMVRVPHGVVAAIAPSNFPIILSMCKVAPALLAGNTVVLKPSPQTPLSTLRVGEILQDCLPPGVLNVVSGDNDLGAALCTHPGVRMISFTGSVETGRAIAQQAAGDFRRVVLELGGNDPAIVLRGSDPASVARSLFFAAMANNGQFCAAVKRIYVPRESGPAFVDALADLAGSVTVGDGMDPATDFGPLISRAQRDRVSGLVDAAVAAGARVIAGGQPLDGEGHFYRPTVVTGLPGGTALEQEEQFGPAIPVIAYDDVSEAVGRANGTRFGLGASLWGDPETARSLAGSLDCGTVWTDTHGDLRHNVPFGGARSSGVGVEYGHWGLLEYTRIKVLNRATR